jgi:large conductance mechanosensitive channel
MFKDFKNFIAKGNVLDLAVGVIIGGAFGKIVAALVDNVIMPPIAFLLGGQNIDSWGIKLGEVAGKDGKMEPVMLAYGKFLATVVDFLIIAFVIFMVVKAYENMKKKEAAAPPAAPPAPPRQEVLLEEIRDLLKK